MSTLSDDNSTSSSEENQDEFTKQLYGFWQDQMTTMSSSPEVIDFFKKMTHNMASFSSMGQAADDKNPDLQTDRTTPAAATPVNNGHELDGIMQRLEYKLNQLDDRLSRIEYLLQKQSTD